MERFLESPGKKIFEFWKTLEFDLSKSWKKAFECLYEPCHSRLYCCSRAAASSREGLAIPDEASYCGPTGR